MKLRAWSFRRWALLITAVILLALIGLRLQLKWQVHRAVAELREAGHPTTFEELNRRQPFVADRPNMVSALTNAANQIPNYWDLEESIRESLPIVGDIVPQHGSTWDAKTLKVTRDYLNANHEAIQEIHAAVAITNASWWVSYEPFGWDMYGMIAARKAVNHLLLEAAFATQSGDLDAALRSIVPVFVLAKRLHDDPIMMTQLWRLRFQEDGLQWLEELLETGTPSSTRIVQLRDILRQLNSQVSLAHAYRGELTLFLEPYFHRSQRVYIGRECERGTFEDYRQRMKVLAYRLSGLADQDVIYAIKVNSEIAAKAVTMTGLMDLAHPGLTFRPSARGLRFHYWSEQQLAELMDIGGGIVGSRLTRFIENHAKLSAADAALAVAQYRLQHGGKLPTSLDELVPEFLESVPVDPRSGKPFELIITDDSYGIGRGTPVFSIKLKPPLREEEPK